MSRYYEYEREEQQKWEDEHDHRLVWKCPECDYSYESERNVNEALNCPDCKCQTVMVAERYRA